MSQRYLKSAIYPSQCNVEKTTEMDCILWPVPAFGWAPVISTEAYDSSSWSRCSPASHWWPGEQQSPSAIHLPPKRREQGMKMLTMVSAKPKKEATKNKPCVRHSKLITFCHTRVNDVTTDLINAPISVKLLGGRLGIGGAFELSWEFLFKCPTPGHLWIVKIKSQ